MTEQWRTDFVSVSQPGADSSLDVYSGVSRTHEDSEWTWGIFPKHSFALMGNILHTFIFKQMYIYYEIESNL